MTGKELAEAAECNNRAQLVNCRTYETLLYDGRSGDGRDGVGLNAVTLEVGSHDRECLLIEHDAGLQRYVIMVSLEDGDLEIVVQDILRNDQPDDRPFDERPIVRHARVIVRCGNGKQMRVEHCDGDVRFEPRKKEPNA